MGGKLGLRVAGEEDTRAARVLVGRWLDLLARNRADYTNSHRALCDYASALLDNDPAPAGRLRPDEQALFLREEVAEFLAGWYEVLRGQGREAEAVAEMRARNPVYIPRNHRVEAAVRKAEAEGDFSPLEELLRVLAEPYRVSAPDYQDPPQEHERVKETFCGT